MWNGSFWLKYTDLEDDDESEEWNGAVNSAFVSEDRIRVEFSGSDPDYGKFSGECDLTRDGAFFIGSGVMRALEKSVASSVNVTKETIGATIVLEGTWRDVGDPDTYELCIELERAADSRGGRKR
jgi:hypothetical protein